MAGPRSVDDWQAVVTLEDFAAYLKLLSKDFARHERRDPWGERWAHGTTGDFLEAFSAWIEDGFVGEDAPWADERPEPSWRSFAWMLWAARGYE